MQVSDADPQARSVIVSFEAPGHPLLARWPLDAEPLDSWRRPDTHHHAHQYTWTDARWNWALRCDIELNDDDLALIADSMIDVAESA